VSATASHGRGHCSSGHVHRRHVGDNVDAVQPQPAHGNGVANWRGTLQSAGKELLARGGLSLPLDAVGEGDCKQGHQCRRSLVELVKSVMKMTLRSLLASDQSILLRRKGTRLVPIIQTHGDVSKMEENLVLLKYLWRNCNLIRDLNQ
jgi:hypothetical protein